MGKIQWYEGTPEELHQGMLCEDDEGLYVVGRKMEKNMLGRKPSNIKRWAWIIKPYELEWQQDMIRRPGSKQ